MEARCSETSLSPGAAAGKGARGATRVSEVPGDAASALAPELRALCQLSLCPRIPRSPALGSPRNSQLEQQQEKDPFASAGAGAGARAPGSQCFNAGHLRCEPVGAGPCAGNSHLRHGRGVSGPEQAGSDHWQARLPCREQHLPQLGGAVGDGNINTAAWKFTQVVQHCDPRHCVMQPEKMKITPKARNFFGNRNYSVLTIKRLQSLPKRCIFFF